MSRETNKIGGSIVNKMDRKTIEKNRRIVMKDLCFKLNSLIPSQHFKPAKEVLSQQDLFDQAASYIKQLKERIEQLESRKRLSALSTADETNNSIRNSVMNGVKLPILRFRDFGCSFEVVLISGNNKKFMLGEVIQILEGGGAEVMTASLSNIGFNVFITLHAKVKVSRVGVDTSGVFQRLQALISSSNIP
ncbi:transcription factor bHLH162-like [Olea europaea var. sylvestris]|uniref:transcription factor bHLH162-like n=1 Tax=Olea europaea var. sylvestris TaxID=158386 RepID=UPI000C1D265C|nr:transcription factor bHLH162-like [Olea europaea var. sylvestris]